MEMCKTMLTIALLLSIAFAIVSSSVSPEIEFEESLNNEDLQSVDGTSPTKSYQANSIRNSRSIHSYSRPELEVYLLKRPVETDRDMVCQCKCANKQENSGTMGNVQNKIQHFSDDWEFTPNGKPKLSGHSIIQVPYNCPKNTIFVGGRCRVVSK